MSDDGTCRSRGFPSLGIACWSFIWGLAEATFFFIVPDVLLTGIAIHSTRSGITACLYALAGALIGGICMFTWGYNNAESAKSFLEQIPAIDREMIETVSQNIVDDGQLALFLGPLQGRPYKIYAVSAGDQETNIASFLLISIPARFIRFLLLTAIAGWIATSVAKRVSRSRLYGVHALCWLSFYCWYFSHFGF